jgi:sterol desaturase/sphingolipid hydroxylase (fatty acid hydroxylase superfamily)
VGSREITTLAGAWRAFRRKRGPWMIAAGIAVALGVRLGLGDLGWADAVAVAAMLVVYPFGEWAIHVYLLHMRPFRVAGRRVELMTARAHREHHEEPNDLRLVNFSAGEALAILLLAVPFVPAIAGLVIVAITGTVPLGALVTAVLAGYVLVGAYEWSHFLIHTAYRPRSRYYRSVWRTHRLHHFKNENYWHGITNTVSDRVLGTFPDQRDVPRSQTARSLHAGR